MFRVLCSVVFLLETLAVAKECVTPYKEKATCVAISKCDVISSALFTLTPRAIQFYKDSQCGCDEGMVCCGTSNNKTYQKLIDCAPTPELGEIPTISQDASICGLDSSTDRIVGGSLVKAGVFPWLVALEYRNKFSKENAGIRCGGTIIAKRFILTAAHCILDVEFEIIQIWLGVTNITSDETCSNNNGEIQCIKTVKKLNVAELIPHEFYNPSNHFNDIGLLRLKDDIEYTSYIRPICIPNVGVETPSIGTYLTVVGWGATETEKRSDVKRRVELVLQDNQICQEYLSKRFQNITHKQFCVGGERGKDSCGGDSGGPLMQEFVGLNDESQWFQQGIVSYGVGCGSKGKPGVYIKVSSYATWIKNKFGGVGFFLEKDAACFINGRAGLCRPIYECNGRFKTAFTKDEYHYFKNVMRRHQCGYQGDTFMVCCEDPDVEFSYKSNTKSEAVPHTTCGIKKNKTGNKDKMVDLPWIAGIEVFYPQNASTEIRCIGTVIHSRYILAAEECAFGDTYDKFESINVWLGPWNSSVSNNGTNGVQKIGIKKIIPYPLVEHYPFVTNVLIFLENEIKFTDFIQPICLNLRNLPKLKAGDNVISVRATDPVSSSDLILVKEFPIRWCSGSGQNNNPKDECEAGKSEDECKTSSAFTAPIMRTYEDKSNGRKQWYLAALRARELCNGNIRITTEIVAYLDWIMTMISENN